MGVQEHPQLPEAAAELPRTPLGSPSSEVPQAALASLTGFGWAT